MATCDAGADLTQCPVCFNNYTEAGDHIPRILPCLCTLCHRCILKLIKNEQLECPHDRKKHPARQGEKSFPQNKYVVSFLKKSHQVENIMDEDKKKLNDQIKTLYSLNIELQRAKQQVKDDCDKKMKKLAERKKEILDELDGKLVDLMDNVATLSDIKNDSANSVDKIEFGKVVKDLCAEAKEPVKVEFYELTKSELEIKKAEEEEEEEEEGEMDENLEENLRKRRKLSLYIIEAKKLFKVSSMAIEVLSDGDVVVVDRFGMTRYDRDSGEVVYSTKLEKWAGGMVEVNLGGRPALAVSYKRNSSEGKYLTGLKLFDILNMYKCTIEDFGDNVSLETICRRSDSTILGKTGKELITINCRKETPQLEPYTLALSSDSYIEDMCVTKDPKGQEILVYIDGDVLHVDTLRGRARLVIEGATGSKIMRCSSVTCDQRGHIFVCNTNDNCIEMFSTDGLYLGTLVSKGEHGIGEPYRVRWCEKTSSLVVVHASSNKSFSITAFKIHYK